MRAKELLTLFDLKKQMKGRIIMITKIKVIVAVVCVAALIMTGTLALEQIIQYTNEFTGEYDDKGPGPDIVLHDDFNPKINQKDVYVENRGEVTMFIRVKLEEAMKIGGNDAENQKNKEWKPGASDWRTHDYTISAIDCDNTNAEGQKFHDYFKWTMGGQKNYIPYTGTDTVAHNLDVSQSTATTPNAQIISVDDYLAMSPAEQKDFVGWILDPDDGYAYWSQPLTPGDVTGLLLNGVESLSTTLKKNYYYGIKVSVEAVDVDDTAMWIAGDPPKDGGNQLTQASDNGQEVVKIILGNSGGNGGGGNGNGGGGNGGTIPVIPPSPTPPAPPSAGYMSRANEDGIFAVLDGWALDTSAVGELDKPGEFRLEDILAGTDYTGLKVTPEDVKYKEKFEIGIGNQSGKPAIIYSFIPSYDDARAVLINTGEILRIPITTKLLLEQGEKSVEITVTMTYDRASFSWPKNP